MICRAFDLGITHFDLVSAKTFTKALASKKSAKKNSRRNKKNKRK